MIYALKSLPWRNIPAGDRQYNRGHGREERRTLQAASVAAGLAFPHAAQAIRITRRILKPTGHASIAAACRHHARDATPALTTLGIGQYPRLQALTADGRTRSWLVQMLMICPSQRNQTGPGVRRAAGPQRGDHAQQRRAGLVQDRADLAGRYPRPPGPGRGLRVNWPSSARIAARSCGSGAGRPGIPASHSPSAAKRTIAAGALRRQQPAQILPEPPAAAPANQTCYQPRAHTPAADPAPQDTADVPPSHTPGHFLVTPPYNDSHRSQQNYRLSLVYQALRRRWLRVGNLQLDTDVG
jgi:hypothetical protein